MSNTNTHQTRIVINPKSPSDGVYKSSMHDFFVNEIVPKQLTIDNCQKGRITTTDTNGVTSSFSPIGRIFTIGQ